MSETENSNMNMNSPETPINLDQEARSEVRSELYEKLSPEQREKLSSTDLTISKQDDFILVKGSVTLDGQAYDLEVAKMTTGDGFFSGQLDHDALSKEDAEELFNFYYPIAEIINEDSHYPTEKSFAVRKDILLARLLRKDSK